MRLNAIYTGFVLAMFSATAIATPFAPMDPRSMAMGGTGAASASASNAVFYNPALLATKQYAKLFSLEVPITVQAADPDNLIKAGEDFEKNKYLNNLDTAVTDFNTKLATFNSTMATLQTAITDVQTGGAPTAGEITALNNAYTPARTAASELEISKSGNGTTPGLTDRVQELKNGVKNLAGRTLNLDADAGVVFAIPSKKLGFSLFAGTWASGGIVAEFAQADDALIDGVTTSADAINVAVLDPYVDATALLTALTDGNPANDPSIDSSGVNLTLPNDNLQSNFQVRAAWVKEVGVALAQERTFFGKTFAVGLTPKLQQITTLDYKIDGAQLQAPSFTLEQGKKDHFGFNVDVGVSKDYGNNWKTGLVIKNLLPMSYDTVLGNKITIGPSMRVGGAYQNKWFLVALDADVTENRPAGLGSESRYVSVGTELDVWLLQLRAGYQHNVSNTRTSMLTAGLGLNLFGLHADLGAGLSEGGVNLGAQLGFTW